MKKEIKPNAKISVYESTLLPSLNYGCESWTLSDRLKRRIQTQEMRFHAEFWRKQGETG